MFVHLLLLVSFFLFYYFLLTPLPSSLLGTTPLHSTSRRYFFTRYRALGYFIFFMVFYCCFFFFLSILFNILQWIKVCIKLSISSSIYTNVIRKRPPAVFCHTWGNSIWCSGHCFIAGSRIAYLIYIDAIIIIFGGSNTINKLESGKNCKKEELKLLLWFLSYFWVLFFSIFVGAHFLFITDGKFNTCFYTFFVKVIIIYFLSIHNTFHNLNHFLLVCYL